jgi:hypothetical protein
MLFIAVLMCVGIVAGVSGGIMMTEVIVINIAQAIAAAYPGAGF